MTFGYNSNHQIVSVAVNGIPVLNTVTFEPFGAVNGWKWGNGITAMRAYNTDGNVSTISSAASNTYSYDNAIRITGITDNANATLSWTYGYDALDRVSSANTPAQSLAFTFDANGNRLTQGGSVSSTYNVAASSNQLSSITGGLTRTYLYNSIGDTTGYGSLSFTHNASGRIISAGSAGVTAGQYLYNALGQRIKKSTAGGTTYFAYDEAGHLIGEYDATGTLIQEVAWLGDTPVATIRNEACGLSVFYVHTDHLNTPRRITRRSTTDVVWSWESDPFGSPAPNQNPSGLGTFSFNLRFPGQYFDAETGLNQNYFRDYDPAVGRYVESDPIGLGSGVNTYAYGEDNPVMVPDRFGLDTAQCTRRLNNVPFRVGPFFHQYVCVGNAQTGYTCRGLGPTGSMFNSPGKLETDLYKPQACQNVLPDNKCVEDCIKKTFGKTPPNYSVDLSHGENCQTYADSTVSECVAQCHANKK